MDTQPLITKHEQLLRCIILGRFKFGDHLLIQCSKSTSHIHKKLKIGNVVVFLGRKIEKIEPIVEQINKIEEEKIEGIIDNEKTN